MADTTIVKDAADDAVAVPDAVIDAIVDSAHDAGETTAHVAHHAEKLAEHELTLKTQTDRLEMLEMRLASLPEATDHAAHERIADLERTIAELRAKIESEVVEPVVETVAPPAKTEPEERPKKKSFFHRLI